MSCWDLRPVRLLDTRTSYGFQVKLNLQQFSGVWSLLPSMWQLLLDWHDRHDRVQDCSLEYVMIHPADSREAETGLVIRLALREDCKAQQVQENVKDLQERLLDALNQGGVKCDASVGDEGILCRYPVHRLETRQYIQYLVKPTKQAGCSIEQALACRLTPTSYICVEECERFIREYDDCGISFEMHSDFKKRREILRRLSERKLLEEERIQALMQENAAVVRTVIWGTEAAAKKLSSLLHAHEIQAETKKVAFSEAVLYQLVYDPWALSARMMESVRTPYMPLAFMRTMEELRAVSGGAERCKEEKKSKDSTEQTALPCISLHTEPEREDLDEKLERIVRNQEEMRGYMRSLEEKNKQDVKLWAEQFEKLQERYQHEMEHIGSLSGQMRGMMDQLEKLELTAPEGMAIAFTAEELAHMGVQTEEELSSKLKLEPYAIHLMRTAFSFARAGRLAVFDPKTVLMPFAVPMGFLYEYLVHRFFKNSLFVHTPRYAEIKNKPVNYGKNFEIQLSDFDRVTPEQLNAYARHADLDGQSRDTFYWCCWLNLLKIVRAFRNKVHVSRGRVTGEQLNILYELMLFQGVSVKKNAVSYVFLNSEELGERLYLNNISLHDFLREMDKRADEFQPNVIQFLIQSGKFSWTE